PDPRRIPRRLRAAQWPAAARRTAARERSVRPCARRAGAVAHGKLTSPASRRPAPAQGGTAVLDCQGLSRLVDDSAPVVALIAEARTRGMEVVVSALTIIEATHRKTNRARLNWLLSGIRIEHVDETAA